MWFLQDCCPTRSARRRSCRCCSARWRFEKLRSGHSIPSPPSSHSNSPNCFPAPIARKKPCLITAALYRCRKKLSGSTRTPLSPAARAWSSCWTARGFTRKRCRSFAKMLKRSKRSWGRSIASWPTTWASSQEPCATCTATRKPNQPTVVSWRSRKNATAPRMPCSQPRWR